MADGNFFSNNMTSCGDGETCSSSKLQCTKDSNPECDGATSQNDFICYALGIFPDPYKCTIYHMCVPDATGVKPNPKSVIIPCPTGFAFDPVTSTCRINMTALGGQCTPAVPMKCVNDTKGPIVQDPSIYYWCMKNPAGQFYPVMFRCTKNQQFIDGICRDLPLAPPLTGTCTKKLRYFDPNDCKAYFDCPGPNYRPFRVQCPSYRRFVFQEQNCVDFSCAPTATNTGVCKL